MTPSEFAAKIRAKHPGAYDDMSDALLTDSILRKYPQYQDMVQGGKLSDVPAGQPTESTPTGGPSYRVDDQGNIVQGTPSAEEVRNEPTMPTPMNAIAPLAEGISTADLAALGGKGVIAGAGALGRGFDGAAEGISSALNKILMTPKAAGATQAMIERAPSLAKALPGYLTEAESNIPGLGQAVAEAGKAGMGAVPDTTTAMITRGAQDVMKEPIQPPTTQPNTSMLQQPISQGLGQSAEMTKQVVSARTAMYGDAIGNTIKGLENTGTSVDAKPFLDKIEGMYERLPNGELATEGVQGDTNAAISDALESVKNVVNNGKMTWTDANRVKSMLQDSANYAAKRFDMSNEAYKTVATLIKDEIDSQAASVLSQTGGDIGNFQMLRQAYSQSKFAEEAARRAAATETGAGTPLQQVATATVSGLKNVAKLGVPAYVGARVLGKVFGR